MQQEVLESRVKTVVDKQPARVVSKYVPKQRADKGKEKLQVDNNPHGEGASKQLPVVDPVVVEDEAVDEAELVGVNNIPISSQEFEIIRNPILGFVSNNADAFNAEIVGKKGSSQRDIRVEDAFSPSSSSLMEVVQATDDQSGDSIDFQGTPIQVQDMDFVPNSLPSVNLVDFDQENYTDAPIPQVVVRDLSVAGRLWSTQAEEEEDCDDFDTSGQERQPLAVRYLVENSKVAEQDGYTVVLTKSQKKKLRKKRLQSEKAHANKARVRGGPKNFA